MKESAPLRFAVNVDEKLFPKVQEGLADFTTDFSARSSQGKAVSDKLT